MASGDLATIKDVELWLNIKPSNADESILPRLITSVSAFIKSYIARDVTSRTYTEKYNGAGGSVLLLREYPITAITSLTVNDSVVPFAATSASYGYVFDDVAIYLHGALFSTGTQNIVVTYTAGYTTVPPELVQACVELVALRYRERGRIGEVSKSVQGETISYLQKSMPAAVQVVLNDYMRVVSV